MGWGTLPGLWAPSPTAAPTLTHSPPRHPAVPTSIANFLACGARLGNGSQGRADPLWGGGEAALCPPPASSREQ